MRLTSPPAGTELYKLMSMPCSIELAKWQKFQWKDSLGWFGFTTEYSWDMLGYSQDIIISISQNPILPTKTCTKKSSQVMSTHEDVFWKRFENTNGWNQSGLVPAVGLKRMFSRPKILKLIEFECPNSFPWSLCFCFLKLRIPMKSACLWVMLCWLVIIGGNLQVVEVYQSACLDVSKIDPKHRSLNKLFGCGVDFYTHLSAPIFHWPFNCPASAQYTKRIHQMDLHLQSVVPCSGSAVQHTWAELCEH